jgi:hypothetical protein
MSSILIFGCDYLEISSNYIEIKYLEVVVKLKMLTTQ